MATATKLTYEDLVEGGVSQHDVLGLLAAGEVEVDAVSRYLALLESKNSQNGNAARLTVSPNGCVTIRGVKGTNSQFGTRLRLETLEWIYGPGEPKLKAFMKEHADELRARSAASKAKKAEK